MINHLIAQRYAQGLSAAIPDTGNIEDVLADLAKDVPDEEWDRVPPDLTDKLDDYLYGGSDE